MINNQSHSKGRGGRREGAGRPKGSPNKTTALLKEAILAAAELHGNDGQGKDGLVGYCQHLASAEPRAFASLLGRVMPLQLTGENGSPVKQDVEIRIISSKEQRDAAVAAAARADR
jgi:hypothetical protein